MSNAQQSLDSFLKHSTRSSDFAKRLGNWKKRSPPAINTFLHTRAPIIALWQHNFPRLVVREDEHKNPRTEVWGGTVNCIEPEEVLRRQYNRNEDDERDHYPTVCPMCRLIETVRLMVRDREIPIAEPVFIFEGTDPSKNRVVTAGGVFNAFSDTDKLTPADLKAMRAAGISPKDAWKENAYAKCNYVFTVVDADSLEDGIQVGTETTLLGDKVKECIHDQLTSMGDEDGNPLLKPYCIRWEHRRDEAEFGKRYKAIAMRKVKATDEILKLIRDTDPPNTSNITDAPNIATLRAQLERQCRIDLPWDDIFGPAEKLAGIDPGDAAPATGDAEGAEDTPETVLLNLGDKAPEIPEVEGDDGGFLAADAEDPNEGASAVVVTASKPDEEVEVVTCDECGTDMKVTEFTCPGCGVEYDEEGNIVKRPAAKKKRSRKAAAEKKASNAKDKVPF